MNIKKALSLLVAAVMLFSVSGGALADFITLDYNPIGDSLAEIHSAYLEKGGFESTDNFLTIDDFSSHVITFINIWSDGCGPCISEMPYFQQVHEQYGDKGVLVVGGVTTWINGNFATEYTYLQNHGYTYMNVVPDSVLRSLYYKNSFTPQTFIVNQEGVVIDFIGGGTTYNNLVSKINYWMSVYGANQPNHNVTFIDGVTNEVIDTQIVQHAQAPVYPVVPVHEGYSFIGWSPPNITAVFMDMTLTANYTDKIYVVTYTGAYNGTENVEYGGSVVLPTLDVPGIHYTFTVNGEPWDGTNITGDVTVYVDFEEDIYTVCIIDGLTGVIISEATAYYGDSVSSPEPPVHYGYVFIGWDSSFDYVTGDMTVTAIYEPVESFTVTFTDGHGGVLDTQSVPYHGAAVAPAEPFYEGWTFAGWDADFSCIEGDLTVNAVWERVYCTVTFTGAYIDEQSIEYGGDAVLPVYNSATICYTFTVDGQDWCPENITADVTVTVSAALIRNTYHTVTFLGMNNEVLSVQSVLHGQAATAPEAPEFEGYRFVGWDRDNFDCVTYAMTRTAIYEPIPFGLPGDVDGDGQVTFLDISALSLFLSGEGTIDAEYLANADFNGDGEATFQDLSDMSIMLIG